MKITAFLGSPRAQGNTDILTKHLLNGAKDAGWETESIALRSLNIRGCVACESCWRNGKPCAINDDMQALYNTIASSHVLVFATPVYWYAPTAIMKAFVDRLVPFNRLEGRPLIKGKRAIVVTAYEEEGPEAADTLLRMFEMSFTYLEVDFVGRIVVNGVGPKGAVLNKPEALDHAYHLGRSLQKP